MNKRWRVLDEYMDTDAERAFATLDQTLAQGGTVISADPVSRTSRIEIDGTGYYLKVYYAAGKRLRRHLGASKISREWSNLLALRDLGIPVANIIAYGEERPAGRFKRGALITEEIVDSRELTMIPASHPALLRMPGWLASVSAQLAAHIRRMHAGGFTHGDLHLRNILVTTAAEPEVYLIDCPSGGYPPAPLLAGRIIKDLANLDTETGDFLRATQRLSFFLHYRNSEGLSNADKLMLKRIMHYKHRKRDKRRHSRRLGNIGRTLQDR